MSSTAENDLRRIIGQAINQNQNVFKYDLTISQHNSLDLISKIIEGNRAGGSFFNANFFLIWYQALTDLTPDVSSPVWTEVTVGSHVTETIDNSLLNIIVTNSDSYAYYEYEVPKLDTTDGCELEAQVQILTSDEGINQGSALSVFDGSYQYMVWLRNNGFNIDGEPNISCSLSDTTHRLKLSTRNGFCKVYVDDNLMQYGAAVNQTTLKQITFGSYTHS